MNAQSAGGDAPRGLPPARRALRLVLIILTAGVVLSALLLQGQRTVAPPVLGTLPDFALTERAGKVVRRTDLDGQPWVADFIFTRCTGMCPALSATMGKVRLGADEADLPARFVSFSVDPVHDTPEVLRAYARRFDAGGDWLFLTGSRDAMYDLIVNGFRLSVGERPADAVAQGGELIAHSDRFVLVDARGRIRGYYHGTDVAMREALLRDLAAVAAGK